jgi:HK97 family phage prohead protease
MRAELRADGLHIDGYVNVPGRKSRPVMTPRGKVIEVIEPGAFRDALSRAPELRMLLDHDAGHELASREAGTLKAVEDSVGLRASSVVTDPAVIDGAKQNRLRGWSFNMQNVEDEMEERAEGLPVRHVKKFDMSEISLIMNRIPVYSATSVEVRADGKDADVETRAIFPENMEYTDLTENQKKDPPKPEFDNSAFVSRLEALKK